MTLYSFYTKYLLLVVKIEVQEMILYCSRIIISSFHYRAEYGCSEVVSRMFKCELCDKEVKHTRNIIGAHMKMVHLISWKEYQEILIKIRQGETVGDLPAPELFNCVICGVSVKYKREHLNKKHQITEDVYDEIIAKKNRGEEISGNYGFDSRLKLFRFYFISFISTN